MRVALLATSLLLPVTLLAAGCGGGVSHLDGAAGPVTAAPATSSAAAPTSAAPTSASPATTTPATTPPTSKSSQSVLGPTGFGRLKLGMTQKQATATGLIGSWKTGGTPFACPGSTRLTAAKGSGDDYDGSVLYSDETGVEVIVAYRGVRTPEGISIGSSRAALLRAYPTWVANESDAQHDGHGWVRVPGNGQAVYRIEVEQNKVSQITLQDQHQNCYE